MRMFVFLAHLVGAAACTFSSPPPEVVDINIAAAVELRNLNGGAVNGVSTLIEDWLYEPLLSVNSAGKISPGIAEVVEFLRGGAVRLRLQHQSSFSDGSSVTLSDLVRVISNTGVAAKSDGQSVVAGPLPSGLPTAWSLLGISVSKADGDKQIGSGPFSIVESDSHHMVLRRRVFATGKVNNIRITAYNGAREAMARVLRGDANLLLQIQSKDIEFFEGVDRLKVVRAPDPHSVALLMNTKTLSRKERVNLTRSLPIRELADTAFGGGCQTEAREPAESIPLIDRKIRLVSAGDDIELSRLGMAVRRSMNDQPTELKRVQVDERLMAMSKGDFDLVTLTPLVWPFEITAMILHTGTYLNIYKYSNLDVDRAYEQDDEQAVNRALEIDPLFIFVCRRQRVAIVDSRIKNPRLGPWGLLESLPDWEVGE